MGEVANRVTGVVANTVGNTVGPVVSALMAAAGIATVNPALAALAIPAGALAGSLTQEGVALVGAAISDKARRVGQFAEAAEDFAGRPIEDLIAQAADDDPLRTLLAKTVEAASGSHDAWKVETLARAFVRGAEDGANVDSMLLLVDSLAGIDVAHVRLLRVLWDAGLPSDRRSIVGLVQAKDPGLRDACPMLMRRLADLKLVRDIDPDIRLTSRKNRCRLVTTLGAHLAWTLDRLGSMSSLRDLGTHRSSPDSAPSS